MTEHPKASESSDGLLTSAQFHILLTLAGGERHGYGIMKEVEERTQGALELGPGTLYRSIKQLLSRGLIVEVTGGGRALKKRRCYALTQAGEARAVEEVLRLRDLVRWAEETPILEGGRA